ncbi:MAG: hypothetical protein DI539_23265 [Flavobacterium psychrophilum]|nr:MAG: hypothetical protein DI539_23265 [Flavobacterium psychrophilum]
MKRILLCIAFVATGISLPKANAQTEKDSVKQPAEKVSWWNDYDHAYYEDHKKRKLEAFEAEKENIVETEKFELKKLLEKIDKRLENGEITAEKATALKQEAAKKSAQNIDSKTAIVESQIELTKRDVVYNYQPNTFGYVEAGVGNATDDKGSFLFGIRYRAADKKPKYDKRTYTDMVFSIGFGGTVGDGVGIGDVYKFGKSGFAEIGFTFRTRLLKDSNYWRLAYGLSYQENTLSPKDNKYFVNNNGHTSLEVYPNQIKRNMMVFENLVVPVLLEFGPSKKKEYKDYFRYDTSTSFKVGIGGFAGMNLGAMQWMKYVENGENVKVKMRRDYNVEKFVYGLKGYVGFGSLSLFAHYELNSVFSKSDYKDHALFFGFRVDL